MNLVSILGKYVLFIRSLFSKPERFKVYWDRTMHEMNSIGVGSVGIVAAISLSVGAVTTVQTAYQLVSGLVAKSIISTILRDSTILELAPTITCLVLAGKVGANIASELGNMSVTEQIDALEVMGINSAAYLALPKIIAGVFVIPLLIFLAMFLSIYGGYIAGVASQSITPQEFLNGIHDGFRGFTITFAYIKSVTFAFLITSISSYHGYYTKGGALEVGRASTKAVVYSCVSILFADYILAQLLLN
ncbi:MAG: ABC transporter permease [Bacteroidetes bacterium]|nr:ABC transporter permease [Bacteroidota bacterium]